MNKNSVNEVKELSSGSAESQAIPDLSVGFTPGPWAVGGEEFGLWVAGPDPNANVICDVLYRNGRVANKEDLANARLIAAAPALYEAARQTLRWLEISAYYRECNYSPIKELRAALANGQDTSAGSGEHGRTK